LIARRLGKSEQKGTKMKTYTINTECGVMKEFLAENIDDAKEAYSQKFGFDFASCANIEGSWYWIAEDGVRVEDHSECMP
jgi:hypothetical protein